MTLQWWTTEKLNNIIALDTETEFITSEGMTPRLVITSVSDGTNSYLIKNQDLPSFLNIHFNNTFVMHNAPFDISVIEKFLKYKDFFSEAIENDRIYDTQILFHLLTLAEVGMIDRKSGLAKLAKDFLGIELNKDNNIRLNFGDFIDEKNEVNYSIIPDDSLRYALMDSLTTIQLYNVLKTKIIQLENKFDISNTALSHKIQLLGAIALSTITKNGIGFNLEAKQSTLDAFQAEMDDHASVLAREGFIRGQKGSKAVFSSVVERLGIDLPLTATGKISSAADDLKPYRTKFPFIESYIKFHEVEKLSSFIREVNSDRIHPRYQLLVNTGRTSSYGPNIQQLPRSGGIREMFIPSKGSVFLDIDYSFLELCTLAQTTYTMFGHSSMRDAINSGKDPHIYAAARIYGITEDKVGKQERQLAKILNFGLGSNMSAATFVEYASGYGVTLSQNQAEDLKKHWVSVFPEMNEFWKAKGKTTNVLCTGRIRSRCSYTAYLNTYFQGLAADGAKISLYLLQKAGFKVVQFVHDSVAIEIEEHLAEKGLKQASEIMIKGMKMVVPDVVIKVDGKISKSLGK